jgi:hypothetical protein
MSNTAQLAPGIRRLTFRQLLAWFEARNRQSEQHPADHMLRMSRGDHYRRKNNGVALRTFQAVRK